MRHMARLNDSRIGSVLVDAYGVRATTRTSSSRHAQHGVALFVTLERDIEVRTAGRTVRGRAVLVPADVEHEVTSPGATIGVCFDPEARPRLAARARQVGVSSLDGRERDDVVAAAAGLRANLGHAGVLAGFADEVAARLGTFPPVRIDARVDAVARALRDPAHEVPDVGISDAHLQALFARDIGVPIRTYRLWRRLLAALAALARGDATSAAYTAGFADLAHFSRTCRRMLGYSPTGIRDGV
jgi:hypothetical protein